MSRSVKQARKVKSNDLIRQIIPIFLEYGYDGAALSRIAAVTKLSKASLYYHFPNGKDDMVRAALAYAGQQMQTLILAPLIQAEKHNLSTVVALKDSFDGVRAYYSGSQPRCLMNSLLLGDRRDLVRGQVKAALTQWIDQLASVLALGGVGQDQAYDLARQIVEQIQGGLVINSLDDGRKQFDQTLDRLQAYLLSALQDEGHEKVNNP